MLVIWIRFMSYIIQISKIKVKLEMNQELKIIFLWQCKKIKLIKKIDKIVMFKRFKLILTITIIQMIRVLNLCTRVKLKKKSIKSIVILHNRIIKYSILPIEILWILLRISKLWLLLFLIKNLVMTGRDQLMVQFLPSKEYYQSQ